VYLVFDFFQHDLCGLLQSKTVISRPQIKFYMNQILSGLHFMHGRGYWHRDIKPSNILVSNNGDVRLGDFGMARKPPANRKELTQGLVTIWYRAPELLLRMEEYTNAIDLWSVACVFAELLLAGMVLFSTYGEKEIDVIRAIYDVCGTPSEDNWPGCSKLQLFADMMPRVPKERVFKEYITTQINLSVRESSFAAASRRATVTAASSLDAEAVDLMDNLLSLCPSKRMTATEALSHSYFYSEPEMMKKEQHPVIKGSFHDYMFKHRKPRAVGYPSLVFVHIHRKYSPCLCSYSSQILANHALHVHSLEYIYYHYYDYHSHFLF
jgi:cyclin-dependent kinase 12/13